MKHYDLILFDLDGTLTDSGPGIMNAVEYALSKLGAPVPERGLLRRFIGPPLSDSFENFCGFTPDGAREAVRVFREYYMKTGILENSVYPGVEQALRRLRGSGRTLAVATSKPEPAAERVLRHFGLRGYFTYLVGSTEDGSLVRKGDIVRCVLSMARSAGLRQPLMVGDREHDVIGARENGLECMGVLYGYGSREELEGAGAAFLARTPGEAAELLLAE